MVSSAETKRILVVEDDPDIGSLLKIHLTDMGFLVDVEEQGPTGLRRAQSEDYSLVILDVMLPGMDGHEICRRLRESDKSVCILMLTLKSELVDKVVGLELGADDYMTKPFKIQELKARVKALMRRAGSPGDSSTDPTVSKKMSFGSLLIDVVKRRVTLSEEELELTPKQFDLLCFLARSPGRPYTRAELLEYVWGYDSAGYEHTVDTHVNRLRSKLEPNPSKPVYLLTVWGVGYRFVEPSEL